MSSARSRRIAGCPGRSTAFAISVAAASAAAASAASTVTASAMPSEKLRPRRPLVAMPADGILGPDRRLPQQGGPLGHRNEPDVEGLARRQEQRDVAAVVHVGAAQATAGRGHLGTDLVGDSPGHGGHRRDEPAVERPHGRGHAARDRPREPLPRLERSSQRRQLGHELVEEWAESLPRPPVGACHGRGRCPCLDDQVDRAVLQVQPRTVGRGRRDRTAHARRRSARASTSSIGTTASMCPPSAA